MVKNNIKSFEVKATTTMASQGGKASLGKPATVDLSDYLVGIRISSSAKNQYDTVILIMDMDYNTHELVAGLGGTGSIDLGIRSYGLDGSSIDAVSWTLAVMSTDFSLATSSSSALTPGDIQRRKTCLHCIPVKPAETLSKIVNYVSPDDFQMTPLEALVDIVSKLGIPVDKMSLDGMNPEPLTKLCVPPMSVGGAATHLDSLHGLYLGGTVFRADPDGSLVSFSSGVESIREASLVLHQPPSARDPSVMDTVYTGQDEDTDTCHHFIMARPLEFVNQTNSSALMAGWNMAGNSFPTTKPFSPVKCALSDMSPTVPHRDQTAKAAAHKIATGMTRRTPGTWCSNHPAAAMMSARAIDMIPARAVISGKFKLSLVTRPGKGVDVIMLNPDQAVKGGRYSHLSSETTLTKKGGEWLAEAALLLRRGL